MTFKNII